jgi:rod shape-determining protein MreD
MSLVLAAVGAAVAALIQSTIIPFVAGGGAELDLVLVLAVIWTMVASLEGGLVWAFLGGLVIDVLLMRPLGLTPLILTLAVGIAWLIGRAFPRAFYPAIVVAAALLGGAASVLTVVLLGSLTGARAGDPSGAVVPAVLFDGLAAALLTPPGILLRRRFRPDVERMDW